MKRVALKQLRTLADKYGLVWHKQGNGWVINGLQQHWSLTSEAKALANYLASHGQSAMTDDDYAIALAANQNK